MVKSDLSSKQADMMLRWKAIRRASKRRKRPKPESPAVVKNGAWYYREARAKAIKALGGQCSSSGCRWWNPDGSLGCRDVKMLDIDHKYGAGNKHRETRTTTQIFMDVLKDLDKYQLLCCNCHRIKTLRDARKGKLPK